jgi:Ser/Thr protein kinase RdoA (MazF antagonist)
MTPNTARSVIPGEALTSALVAAYDLPQPIDCELHVVGDNDSYYVHAGPERFALRVYYPNRYWLSGSDEYRFELSWLSFCHDRGLPVSYPIPRRDGELLSEMKALEGPRPWALFSYVEGTPVFPLQIEQHRRYGEFVARFHIESLEFSSPYARFAYGEAAYKGEEVLRGEVWGQGVGAIREWSGEAL